MANPKFKSFTSLINKIDWVMISPRSFYHTVVSPDDIAVCFAKGNKQLKHANEIRIKFGFNVIKELGWELKDRIAVFHDPDNLMNFMLVKNEQGFTLGHEAKSPSFKIAFRWKQNLPLEVMPYKKVKFQMDDGKVVFDVNEKFDD